MAKLSAMRDELQKIAATKSRSYTRPITAANLASKTTVDKSSGELKTAGIGIAKKLIKSPGKLGVTAAGSIAAWETGKQALRDYQLGRAIRKQQRR